VFGESSQCSNSRIPSLRQTAASKALGLIKALVAVRSPNMSESP
jgi:hypothetical protein